jgi:hypothetical protein
MSLSEGGTHRDDPSADYPPAGHPFRTGLSSRLRVVAETVVAVGAAARPFTTRP